MTSPAARFGDESAVFRYLAKWVLLLTPVSIAVGAASALFLRLLDTVTETRWDNGWLLFLLPVAGLASAALYHWFGRSVEGGNNLLVDEIHEPGGGVPPRIIPLIFVATVGAHLFGASVGREGTAVQMGGGIASAFNRVFRLGPGDLRILLIAGIAAGFGSIFGTPFGGAVFAIEVIAIGRLEYRAFVPALYGAIAADLSAEMFGAHHTTFAVAAVDRIAGLPIEPWLLTRVAVAGVVFGLVALLFAELTHDLGRLFRVVVRTPLLRPVIGGLITVGLVYALGTRDYLGIGVSAPDADATSIVSAFEPGGASGFAWWWKLAFTAVAIGSGFRGGEVTPLFFIGATLGNRLAGIADAPVDLFAALGFVAVFAGAANTPLACTVMGVELFGADAAPYLAVACGVAYLVSGHSGIYLAQRVHRPKPGRGRPPPGAVTLRALKDARGSLPLRWMAAVRRRL